MKTNRMMTVIVTALITTFRLRRSCSCGGSSTGGSDCGSRVRFLSVSSNAIMTITKTIEQTMNINHHSRLRLSACGPAGFIEF
jgi:hypothetical protein